MSEQLLKRSFIRRDEDACPIGDAELVRRAREDCLTFAEIYRRYRDRVYGYLRLRTPTDEEAADLTQDVFFKALDALPRYRERGLPFAAWLMRIARNLAIDSARQRRPVVDLDLVPEAALVTEDSDPEAGLIELERLEKLRGCIADLDKDKRDLLALRFVAGLSTREIGLVIGKSEEATKKRIGRTLRRLRNQLSEE